MMQGATGTGAQLRRSYGGDDTKVRTLDMLQLLLKNRGEEALLDTLPIFGGRVVDLVELYVVVIRHGGYEMVTAQGLWPAIARLLGLPANDTTEQRLMQTYRRVLQSFEDYIRLAQGLPAPSIFTQRTQPQISTPIPTSHPQPNTQYHPQNTQQQRYAQALLTTSQVAEKRKRAPLPTSSIPVAQPLKVLQAEVEAATFMLASKDWTAVAEGLNKLTRLSVDSDKDMVLENFPGLLAAIATAMDNSLPVAQMAFDEQISSYVRGYISHGDLSWHAVIGNRPVVDHLIRHIPANNFEVSLLNLVRNLSIEPMNEMQIAHSATIMRHLCVCLVNPTTDAASYAFDIMAQVCRYVDITGRKRIENDMWLEDTLSQDKATMKLNLSADLSAATTAEYLIAVWGVFAGVMRALFRDEKELILRALDLLIRLSFVPENKSAFLGCPQEMLERIVQLLCVTYSSTDPSAVYESEGAFGLQKGYGSYLAPAAVGDYEERVDTDIRDVTVDFIVQLCNLGPEMQGNLVAIPEFLPIVRQLVRTKVGRQDIPRLVAGLLNQLSTLQRLHPALALTQLEFVRATCEGHDVIADLTCGGLREIFAVSAWTDTTTLNTGLTTTGYTEGPMLPGNV